MSSYSSPKPFHLLIATYSSQPPLSSSSSPSLLFEGVSSADRNTLWALSSRDGSDTLPGAGEFCLAKSIHRRSTMAPKTVNFIALCFHVRFGRHWPEEAGATTTMATTEQSGVIHSSCRFWTPANRLIYYGRRPPEKKSQSKCWNFQYHTRHVDHIKTRQAMGAWKTLIFEQDRISLPILTIPVRVWPTFLPALKPIFLASLHKFVITNQALEII